MRIWHITRLIATPMPVKWGRNCYLREQDGKRVLNLYRILHAIEKSLSFHNMFSFSTLQGQSAQKWYSEVAMTP